MAGTEETWQGQIHRIVAGLEDGRARINRGAVRDLVNTYLVRSLDTTALRFSLPLLIPARDPGPGADGAAGVIIEAIKAAVPTERDLGPIAGVGTEHPRHCLPNIEPVTLMASRSAIGTDLWRPDDENRIDADGLHLVVRGALPYPGPPAPGAIGEVLERFSALAEALDRVVRQVPERVLTAACDLSVDQKALRRALPGMGLVAFIADGTRPARNLTPLRCHHRIAGPKEGVHVPFCCPQDLDPVEVEVAGSGRVVTGLALRRREAFAIAGSNAEGKSTLLHAVIAGQDDHAAGDGREYLVSLNGIARAEAGERYLAGADVSLFFRRLPPGLRGDPGAVSGQGSGSLVMAHEIQTALKAAAPLLILDEDRSATNLLVPGCLQSGEVTPLSTLIATRRETLGETALLFAASSLDILIAQADRILHLSGHEARALDPPEFRRWLDAHLAEVREHLAASRPSREA
ncbi:P-loop domain-containing protein [Methanoculleus sp.]|uniref:P-loop domain-containing protein n=1 Tax=Methanoculleus sp. TaxID=90427 RepID=UPI0025E403EE|nr:P-loop domain-containing protein [Methanoculleus sp.]